MVGVELVENVQEVFLVLVEGEEGGMPGGWGGGGGKPGGRAGRGAGITGALGGAGVIKRVEYFVNHS